jgi:hypothetical protein
MAKIQLAANLRPSAYMKTAGAARGDLSETTRARLIKEVVVLSRTVRFYSDGTHTIDGLRDDEAFDSEILRFMHASLISGTPIGHRETLYVDMNKDPLEIVIHGKPLRTFVSDAVAAINNQGDIENGKCFGLS